MQKQSCVHICHAMRAVLNEREGPHLSSLLGAAGAAPAIRDTQAGNQDKSS